MNEIWPKGKTRNELEENIYQLAENVPVGDRDSIDWLYSQELDQFIHAWYTLAKYYEISDDTEIGVEAISEYVSYVRLLRRVIGNTVIESQHRQQAEDKLSELDAMMDELIKHAGGNLNYQLSNE